MNTQRKETRTEQRDLVIQHYQLGKTVREIAEILIIPKSTIGNIIKRFKNTKNIENRPGRGRKNKLTNRQKTTIVREVMKNRRLSAPKMVPMVENMFGVTVSPSTIRNVLKENGFNGRVPRKKPLISKKNRILRLKFARDHISKPLEFWNTILWSDESKYNIYGSDGRIKVWRKVGEEMDLSCILPTVKFGGGSVMVWGCMAASGAGKLEFIEGIMVKEIYKGILEKNLDLSATELGIANDFHFQQDNDPKHTAKIVTAYFEENKIKRLKTPPQSPDLNPIEHLWEHVDRQIRNYPINNKNTLRAAIIDVWNNIPVNVCKKLVESMPERLREVILKKGNPTRY